MFPVDACGPSHSKWRAMLLMFAEHAHLSCFLLIAVRNGRFLDEQCNSQPSRHPGAHFRLWGWLASLLFMLQGDWIACLSHRRHHELSRMFPRDTFGLDGSAAILLSVEVFYVLILIPTYRYVSVQIEKHLPIKLLNVPWLPGGDCTYFYFKFHNCQSHIHIYWLTYLVLNDFRTLNALYHASLDEHVGVELRFLTTRKGFDHNFQ